MITGGTLPSNVSLSYGLDEDKPENPKEGAMYLATDSSIFYVCYSTGNWSNATPELTKTSIDAALGFTTKDLTKSNIDTAVGFTTKDLTSSTIISELGYTPVNKAGVYLIPNELGYEIEVYDTLVSHTIGSEYTFKQLTISSNDYAGIKGLSFYIKTKTTNSYNYFIRLYVNGVLATEKELTAVADTYQSNYLSITNELVAGDIVQFRMYCDGSSPTAYSQIFRVRCGIAVIFDDIGSITG